MSLAFAAQLFGITAAHAAGVPIEQATAEQKTAAQQAFQAGIKLFDAKQFGPAFKEFSGSYEVVKSPNAHFMMARCLTEMGELARAFNELLVAEDEARASPKYKTTLNESSQLRQELARKVAVIVITLNGSEQATITVDGAQIPLRKQHAIAPGEVEIVATVHGEVRKRERVNLLPGDVRPITLDVGNAGPGPSDVTPPPGGGDDGGDDTRPTPHTDDSGGGGTAFYVVGGVAAAAAVGSGVLWGVTGADWLSRKSRRKTCHADSDRVVVSDIPTDVAECQDLLDEGLTEDEDAGKQSATLAVAGGIMTVGFALLSAGMFIGGALSSSGGSSEASAVNVQVIPGPTGVTVLGTF